MQPSRLCLSGKQAVKDPLPERPLLILPFGKGELPEEFPEQLPHFAKGNGAAQQERRPVALGAPSGKNIVNALAAANHGQLCKQGAGTAVGTAGNPEHHGFVIQPEFMQNFFQPSVELPVDQGRSGAGAAAAGKPRQEQDSMESGEKCLDPRSSTLMRSATHLSAG